MSVLLTAAGAAAILVALRDMFLTLFDPEARGRLSRTVSRAVWRAAHAVRARRALTLAGPLGMLAVVASWVALLAAGWALVYMPWLPERFTVSQGADGTAGGFWDALYVSLVTLATLGYGDIAPAGAALRVVAPIQALVGFALLSAAISWVIAVHGILGDARRLAVDADALARARRRSAVEPAELPGQAGAAVLRDLARGLARVRVGLRQYPSAYYFAGGPLSPSLPEALGQARELSARGARSPDPAVRLAAAELRESADGLLRLVDDEFLGGGRDPAAALGAFARDHGHRARTPASASVSW